MVRFPIKQKKKKLNVVVPSGSYVRAKLMTGVSTPEGKFYPSLLVQEESYTGPNKTKIDLSGCFALAKTQAQMSSERIEFKVYKLSCVSKRGRMIERKVNGYVVDNKDQNFAIKAELKSNQSRVATMAFMNSIVNGIGEIINRKAQNIGGANPDTNTSNVIVQRGASGAANTVAQWYLQQANNLSATLNIRSGHDVFIVMNKKVILPKSYFESKKRRKQNEEASLFKHLIK